MVGHKSIKLTSAEIAQLWSAYLNDSLGVCMLKHFRSTVEDPDVRPIIQSTLEGSEENLRRLEQFFRDDQIPIPHGFTDDDVNPEAPRLFSDPLMLQYIKNMGSLGMSAYSIAISMTARIDVREYFSECMHKAVNYHNRATDLLLSKGLYIRAPYIPVPEAPEFVHKESFLNGFFGDRRPLNSIEISQLFYNSITNALGEALMVAYSQTAQDKDVRDFIVRGRDMAHNQIKACGQKLGDDMLPSPTTWESATDSTVPAFSDKLMLFHTTFLVAAGIANSGISIATCSRKDLGVMYAKDLAECATYAAEGAKLLIERGWMEKVPGAVDRDALVMQ